MLVIVRGLGFLAPIAVSVCALVVTGLPERLTSIDRALVLLVMGVAVAAGMTMMALLAWSYVGWRMNRLASGLERTLSTDAPIQMREAGIPAERRLARAFNAASGAFVQVEARAMHDRLTGVPNRETLLIALVAEVDRAVRHAKPLSLAFIDIDRFKPINDTYGHNSGDAVLRQVARLVAGGVRVSDTFGRYGGEEFM
ncbi:MAG: GGDEF domain-containing protein, partial [Candidatus Limnocylindria bacterium]